MSENTTAPEHQPENPDHGQGNYVGGSFGADDGAEDQQTTAQQIEAEQEEPTSLIDEDPAPAAAQEFVTEPSDADSFASDVEGTGTEPAPGDRNEPV